MEERGAMTRFMGRLLSEGSPDRNVLMGYPPTIPMMSRVEVPEFPIKSTS